MINCEVCLDYPNQAEVLVDDIYMCKVCFEEISVNISTSALEEMRVI